MILDHVGNTLRLGHHLQDRDWSLEGKKKGSKEPITSVKVCPKCYVAMAAQASVCPECGHVFTVDRRELVTVEGTLQELKIEKSKGVISEEARASKSTNFA